MEINSHFYVRSRVGVQYLVHNPGKFIEINIGHSWQDYFQRMSCQETWADVIMIQPVANCFKLLIHTAESNPTFLPVIFVEPIHVTNSLNIYTARNSSCLRSTRTVELSGENDAMLLQASKP